MTSEDSEGLTSLVSPVVLFIFNRPQVTARVFDQIRQARPSKLFIVGDGARPNRRDESELVERTREIVSRIDWPVELSTNFSDKNLGCKKRITSGLDWVFSKVDSAIIIEDDCLPGPDFFRFTDQLLEHYRHDERVGAITGTNPIYEGSSPTDSYLFSKTHSVWGWASWARVWKNYDADILDWPDKRKSSLLSDNLSTRKAANYWRHALDGVYKKAIDTWDYQFTYLLFKTGQLSVVPARNLVSNIGFGPGATHTLDPSSALANLSSSRLEFPLLHPSEIKQNHWFDKELQARFVPETWRLWIARLEARLPTPIAELLRIIYFRVKTTSKFR